MAHTRSDVIISFYSPWVGMYGELQLFGVQKLSDQHRDYQRISLNNIELQKSTQTVELSNFTSFRETHRSCAAQYRLQQTFV